MQRSKFDIGSADAGAGGMSISSGSGGASGMGASSSSSDASAMAHSTGSSGVHALFSSQRSVTTRAAHSAEDWRRHALFMAKPSKEPSRTERARVALACVWMQLLKLRKTATSQGCKYEVLRGGMNHSTTCGESGLHGGQGGLAGVDAGHVPEKDPRLSFFAWVHRVVQTGRELQDRGRRGPAVLRWDVAGALARDAPVRRRLSCQRVRSAPACPAPC